MVYYTLIDINSSAKQQHMAAHKLLDESLMRTCGIKNHTLVLGEHGKPFLEKRSDIFLTQTSHTQITRKAGNKGQKSEKNMA